jgi:P-type Cu2+ transporter
MQITSTSHKNKCDFCGSNPLELHVKKSIDNKELFFCCEGCLRAFEKRTVSEMPIHQSNPFNIITPTKGNLHNDQKIQSTKTEIIHSIAAEYITDTREIILNINGMRCASCSGIIDQSLRIADGVVDVHTNYASDTCKVKYLPSKISKNVIIEKINSLGYSANEYTGDAEFKKEQRQTLIRFGVAGFISMNIMMMTIPSYWNYFEKMDTSIISLFGWLMFILSIPVLFISGLPIMKKALFGLIHGKPGMETLIGMSSAAAFIYSTIALVFFKNPRLYFDTATCLIVIILFGKYVENSFRYRASEAIHSLYQILPKKIRQRMGSDIKWVSPGDLSVGAVFEVQAGETIPADGEVVDGNAYVDESMFTGESKVVEKYQRSKVFSGCVIKNGFLQIRLDNLINKSVLHTIVNWIEESLRQKSAVQSYSDKIAAYFVPGIIFLAFSTFIVVLSLGFSFEESFLRALTVLAIACPCAIAIAVPISTVTLVGSLAKQGIFVRDPDVLQNVDKVKEVVFDKTGTLTEGVFSILGCYNKTGNIDDKSLYKILASLESHSSHPIAESIKTHAKDCTGGELVVKDIVIGENGVNGYVDSSLWSVGSRLLFKDDKYKLSDEADSYQKKGNSVVYFGRDSIIEGYIWIGDVVRNKMKNMINLLAQRGLRVHILSGDNQLATESFGKEVGVQIAVGGKSPVEKIEYVKIKKNESSSLLMMIGDGINDAAALAEADVSIAMSDGTDLAKSSSSVIIFNNFIDRIPLLFSQAKKFKMVTRQNLLWAIAYNGVGITLAVLGVLNPLIAALMMMLSSITVVLNALRLKIVKL